MTDNRKIKNTEKSQNTGSKHRVVSQNIEKDRSSKQSSMVPQQTISVQTGKNEISFYKNPAKNPEQTQASVSEDKTDFAKCSLPDDSDNKGSWQITPLNEQDTDQPNPVEEIFGRSPVAENKKQSKKRHHPKQTSSFSKWLFMIIAAVVLLVALIEGISVLNRSQSNKDADTEGYSSSSSSVTAPVSEAQASGTYPAGTDPDTLGSITQLVNRTHGLPTEYAPSDLVQNNLPGVRVTYLRAEAAQALSELFASAENDGISLICCSGFRSYTDQQEVYANNTENLGEEVAYMTTAQPGFSEHQTGLAMDLTSESMNYDLTTDFINTAEGQWVTEHAWQYGFIVRYPNGLEGITGYTYEPWHIRYLGKEVSKAVYESGKTYEEYLGVLN